MRPFFPISVLQYLFGQEIFSEAAYAFEIADSSVSPSAVTPKTRPPLVKTELFSYFVPAWKTKVPSLLCSRPMIFSFFGYDSGYPFDARTMQTAV